MESIHPYKEAALLPSSSKQEVKNKVKSEEGTSSRSSSSSSSGGGQQMTPNTKEEVKRGFDELVRDSEKRAGSNIGKKDF